MNLNKHRWRLPFALAGAAGAVLWALQQPLDKRLFRHPYDDVQLLGTLVTRGPLWKPLGYAMHAANGAAFGAAYSELWRRTPGVSPHATAMAMVMAENFAFWPLAGALERHHPAIIAGDTPRVTGGARALAQATWRHAILGLVLGAFASRARART